MFVKITNGAQIFRVSQGSYNNFYKHQGYIIVDEERERQDKFEEQMNEEEGETNDGELELLASTPLSELNRSQLKKYAAFLGVDLTGVTSVKEARERVKAKLDEE